MMARQHGANLFEGTYNNGRKTVSGNDKSIRTHNERNSSSSGRKEEILNSLKGIRDRTTFKDWRNGITGSIQFSAKIVTNDEGDVCGNSTFVNNNACECQHERADNDDKFLSLPKMNPLNTECDICDDHGTGIDVGSDERGSGFYDVEITTKSTSTPIYSKTGAFLCLEIEKCLDLRIPTLSRLNTRLLMERNKKGSLLCPFVLIKLNNQEVGRTPALQYTSNPIWYDEFFQIPICDKCKDLTIEVWEEIPPKPGVALMPGEQNIGNFVGKCTLNVQSMKNQEFENNNGFRDFKLDLIRWRNDKSESEELGSCSCPLQEMNKYSLFLGSLSGSSRRETVRVQPRGNSLKGKRRRLPSLLVEKPITFSSLSFKTTNPLPYRRKDIREMNIENNEESFWDSPYIKSMVLLVVYLSIGVIGYSFTFENWVIRDSVYFSVVTFSTVGYGDIRPDSDGAKLFTCVFALMGIGIIGIALGFIGQNLVHAQIAALQRSQRKEDTKPESTLESFPLLRNVILFICPIAVMTLFGSIVVGSYEGWNWIDSLYWCVMTSTSVGYGDFVPRSSQMRWFSVLYIPLSVGCTSAALGKIANIFVEQEIAKANSKLLKREVTLEDLEVMNADGDGEVSLLEFVEHMLKVMNKVDQSLLDELHDQFEKLDADGSGGLQQDDLEILTERKLKERRQQAIEKYKSNLLHRYDGNNTMSRWHVPPIIPNG